MGSIHIRSLIIRKPKTEYPTPTSLTFQQNYVKNSNKRQQK